MNLLELSHYFGNVFRENKDFFCAPSLLTECILALINSLSTNHLTVYTKHNKQVGSMFTNYLPLMKKFK